MVMHQSAVLDGPALDTRTLKKDGMPLAEIDISRGQVVQASCHGEYCGPVFGSHTGGRRISGSSSLSLGLR
jgi:hypothetical protein